MFQLEEWPTEHIGTGGTSLEHERGRVKGRSSEAMSNAKCEFERKWNREVGETNLSIVIFAI